MDKGGIEVKRKIMAMLGIALAVSLIGATVASAAHRFTDVPDSNTFHDDIGWMSDNGIALGYEDGTYRPGADVTREELAGFMHRLFDRVSQDIPAAQVAAVSPPGAQGPQGPKGDSGPSILNVYAAHLVASTPICTGGTINDRYTDLKVGFELPAGTYEVTVEGEFILAAADAVGDAVCGPEGTAAVASQKNLWYPSDGNDHVWPQLSLWIDRSQSDEKGKVDLPDGKFDWHNNEGDISPNAQMPEAYDRHIAVSGTTILTLTEKTYVGLIGFGYASNGSGHDGVIQVRNSGLVATRVNVVNP